MSERKGFKCSRCKTTHTFPAYVYARWTDLLTHTCDTCGALHDIREGRAVMVQDSPTPEKFK